MHTELVKTGKQPNIKAIRKSNYFKLAVAFYLKYLNMPVAQLKELQIYCRLNVLEITVLSYPMNSQ